MDEAKKNITLDSDDEYQESVGHMLIHEDPASPDTTPGTTRVPTPEPTHGNSDSTDSDYYANTICDSPRSTDTTLELHDDNEVGVASGVGSSQCHEKAVSSDESEVGEGSSDSNEPHGITPNESTIIQNCDETGLLFSPRYKSIKKRKDESEDEN